MKTEQTEQLVAIQEAIKRALCDLQVSTKYLATVLDHTTPKYLKELILPDSGVLGNYGDSISSTAPEALIGTFQLNVSIYSGSKNWDPIELRRQFSTQFAALFIDWLKILEMSHADLMMKWDDPSSTAQ